MRSDVALKSPRKTPRHQKHRAGYPVWHAPALTAKLRSRLPEEGYGIVVFNPAESVYRWHNSRA